MAICKFLSHIFLTKSRRHKKYHCHILYMSCSVYLHVYDTSPYCRFTCTVLYTIIKHVPGKIVIFLVKTFMYKNKCIFHFQGTLHVIFKDRTNSIRKAWEIFIVWWQSPNVTVSANFQLINHVSYLHSYTTDFPGELTLPIATPHTGRRHSPGLFKPIIDLYYEPTCRDLCLMFKKNKVYQTKELTTVTRMTL